MLFITGYANVVFEDDRILSDLPMDPCGFNPPFVITNTPTDIIAPNYSGQILSRTKCDWKVVVSPELLIKLSFLHLDLNEE